MNKSKRQIEQSQDERCWQASYWLDMAHASQAYRPGFKGSWQVQNGIIEGSYRIDKCSETLVSTVYLMNWHMDYEGIVFRHGIRGFSTPLI